MALYSAQRYAEAAAVPEGSSQSCNLWTGMYLPASLARLDRFREARAVVTECSTKRPQLSLFQYAANEPYKGAADLEHLLGALRTAGLPE